MKNLNFDTSLIEEYRLTFQQTSSILLPGLIKPNALKKLLEKLEKVSFVTKFEMTEMNKFGKVLFVPTEDPILFTFKFLFNDRSFFSVLESVTNCSTIGNFVGRIHRSKAGEDHEIKWHDDNSDSRLLAMTICLGETPYSGAELQIREKLTKEIVAKYGQLNVGDAVIFNISEKHEHRLTPIESGSRTVGVGWFRGEPDFDTFSNMIFKPY